MIKIGNKIISIRGPVFVIAEAGANFRISDNPEENYRHALKLIDIAVKANADSVKFQLYKSTKLYVDNAGDADYIGKDKSINKIISEMELPIDWLKKLKDYCDKKNIIFLCTPFDEESVDELEKINIKAYKISSYSISHIPLIKHIAKTNKPIIISTGAANITDINKAISAIKEEGNNQIALMQCTAKYPAPLETINLKVITELIRKYQYPVGLSDHSREHLIAPLGAVALGATIIEKHFTTDNSLPGPDHKFAILPNELIEMVSKIKLMEKCLGNSVKKVEKEEKELFDFCRRHIYAIKEIKKGETFTKQNIAVLRSGNSKKGVKPEYMDEIINKNSTKNIKKSDPILIGGWK